MPACRPTIPATRSYFSHDPAATDATYGDRPECSECHNPHDSTSTASVPGSSGWSASGLIAGAPATSVSYGTGSPVYTLVNRPTLEYQLCLKCHSGNNTTLPSNTGHLFSRYILDKGVELNPGNASYHPISAPGTNGTDAMIASLAGPSPYKLWNFTAGQTVRCLNCHADARVVGAATPERDDARRRCDAIDPRQSRARPAHRRLSRPGAQGSAGRIQRGRLRRCASYATRRLHSSTRAAACASDTNFRFHGLHVSGAALINHGNDATNIDQPGDGSGLAICAECHFRIHSTAFPVYGQPSGPRLVDFAPNVSGGLTPTSWTGTLDHDCGHVRPQVPRPAAQHPSTETADRYISVDTPCRDARLIGASAVYRIRAARRMVIEIAQIDHRCNATRVRRRGALHR